MMNVNKERELEIQQTKDKMLDLEEKIRNLTTVEILKY